MNFYANPNCPWDYSGALQKLPSCFPITCVNSDTEWIYCKTEMKKKCTKKQNKVRDIHGSIPGVKPAGTQLQGMTASIPYNSEGEETPACGRTPGRS